MVGNQPNRLKQLENMVRGAFVTIHRRHFNEESYGPHKWRKSKRAQRQGGKTLQDDRTLYDSWTGGYRMVVSGLGIEHKPNPDPGVKWVHNSLIGKLILPKTKSKLAIPFLDSSGKKITKLSPSQYGLAKITPGWTRRDLVNNYLYTNLRGPLTATWKLMPYAYMPGRKIDGMADEVDRMTMQQAVQTWAEEVIREAYRQLEKHSVPRHLRGAI